MEAVERDTVGGVIYEAEDEEVGEWRSSVERGAWSVERGA